jgi:hypothetical protein
MTIKVNCKIVNRQDGYKDIWFDAARNIFQDRVAIPGCQLEIEKVSILNRMNQFNNNCCNWDGSRSTTRLQVIFNQ